MAATTTAGAWTSSPPSTRDKSPGRQARALEFAGGWHAQGFRAQHDLAHNVSILGKGSARHDGIARRVRCHRRGGSQGDWTGIGGTADERALRVGFRQRYVWLDSTRLGSIPLRSAGLDSAACRPEPAMGRLPRRVPGAWRRRSASGPHHLLGVRRVVVGRRDPPVPRCVLTEIRLRIAHDGYAAARVRSRLRRERGCAGSSVQRIDRSHSHGLPPWSTAPDHADPVASRLMPEADRLSATRRPVELDLVRHELRYPRRTVGGSSSAIVWTFAGDRRPGRCLRSSAEVDLTPK